MARISKTAKVLIIILICTTNTAEAARIFKFKSTSSDFSPNYFSNFTLFTKNDAIYVEMDIIEPLTAGFKANIEFQLRLSNSKEYQTLFAYTLDVCSVVVSFKDTIFKKWFKSLLKYGNFMLNCPVTNGHYYINGWSMDSSLVPSYLYPGDYRIKGHGFTGRYKTKSEVFVIDLSVAALIEEVP